MYLARGLRNFASAHEDYIKLRNVVFEVSGTGDKYANGDAVIAPDPAAPTAAALTTISLQPLTADCSHRCPRCSSSWRSNDFVAHRKEAGIPLSCTHRGNFVFVATNCTLPWNAVMTCIPFRFLHHANVIF